MQYRHSLSTHGFASRSVGRHKDRLIVVNTQNGLPLERVKNKRIFLAIEIRQVSTKECAVLASF